MEANMICHLNEKPYHLIESGIKTIEMRLNDEKRKKLKKGDIIKFINRTNEEAIFTKVKELHHFDTFTELYNSFPKEVLGYLKEEEANPKDMETYYPEEEQKKYGVVGIEIEKV